MKLHRGQPNLAVNLSDSIGILVDEYAHASDKRVELADNGPRFRRSYVTGRVLPEVESERIDTQFLSSPCFI